MYKFFQIPTLYRPLTRSRLSTTTLVENTVKNFNNRLRIKEEQYADTKSTPFTPEVQSALEEIYNETVKAFDLPQMITSNVCAKFLHQIVRVLEPSRILEFGTFTGTSTIAMASALKANGKITSFDVNADAQRIARRYIDKLQLTARVNLCLENGLDSLLTITKEKSQFDLLYLDADKRDYMFYFDMIMDNNLLSDRGMILADDVLFYGKVAIDAGYVDHPPFSFPDHVNESAAMLHKFNQHVLQDPRVQLVTLPLFDGFSIITKKRS